MSGLAEAIGRITPRNDLFAWPNCLVGRHAFHQYEIVRRTKPYLTWKCRLCGRAVRQPTEEIGR